MVLQIAIVGWFAYVNKNSLLDILENSTFAFQRMQLGFWLKTVHTY